MKTLNGKRPFSYKDLLYKTLIFITTVSIIVYFLPKEGKFNYDEFDINTPWKYGLLQASFDFPIYKNEQQVQKEQDSILATYQPYFHLDKEIGKSMQKKLREDYNKNLRNVLPVSNYIRYIERALEDIYNHGIISAEDVALIIQTDLQAGSPDTVGLRLFAESGIQGIRGEVAQGLPSVGKLGLPIYLDLKRQGLPTEQAGSVTLLHLIGHVEDTNMISRGGLDGAKEGKDRALALLAGDPIPSQRQIESLDDWFIRRNLSPGGCADLLAAIYFVERLSFEPALDPELECHSGVSKKP